MAFTDCRTCKLFLYFLSCTLKFVNNGSLKYSVTYSVYKMLNLCSVSWLSFINNKNYSCIFVLNFTVYVVCMFCMLLDINCDSLVSLTQSTPQ